MAPSKAKKVSRPRAHDGGWGPVAKQLEKIRRVYARAVRQIRAVEAGLRPVTAPLTKSQRAMAGAELLCIREEFFPTRTRNEGVEQIYFIQSVGGGPIKIGWTKNVDARVRALQTSSAARLVVLGTCEGTRSLEAELHRRLAPHRHEGEWFLDCAEVRALMARLVGAGDAPTS